MLTADLQTSGYQPVGYPRKRVFEGRLPLIHIVCHHVKFVIRRTGPREHTYSPSTYHRPRFLEDPRARMGFRRWYRRKHSI